jgi:hypothetical protein
MDELFGVVRFGHERLDSVGEPNLKSSYSGSSCPGRAHDRGGANAGTDS